MAFAQRAYLWKLADRRFRGNDDVAERLYRGTSWTVKCLNGSRPAYPSMPSCSSLPSRRWTARR
jgi:hypothetical protein